MAKVRTEIEIDEVLLGKLDKLAAEPGRDRNSVIEELCREKLDGASAADLLPQVEARSFFPPEQNRAIAQAEAAAMSVEHEALDKY